MAKALFGHIAVAPDRRLVDELTYLRTRVRTLEDELTRLRLERDALVAGHLDRATIERRLEELAEMSEPALA